MAPPRRSPRPFPIWPRSAFRQGAPLPLPPHADSDVGRRRARIDPGDRGATPAGAVDADDTGEGLYVPVRLRRKRRLLGR